MANHTSGSGSGDSFSSQADSERYQSDKAMTSASTPDTLMITFENVHVQFSSSVYSRAVITLKGSHAWPEREMLICTRFSPRFSKTLTGVSSADCHPSVEGIFQVTMPLLI